MAGSRNRKSLTDAERDERRKADRERIERAARALLSSDGWERWIRVRARNGLSRYSIGNQMLIAIECHARGITPTYVAGFRAFLALNRCVRKGEKAIHILAPVAIKRRDEHGEESGEKKVFLRTVPVFDVSMTDALPGKQPVALLPPSQPITGDSHHHLIGPLTAHARELGYGVAVRDLSDDSPGGWCDPKRHKIVVADGPANRQVRTLVHELAHAHGLGYDRYGREQAEVLVDCVTYIVCSSLGLDVGGESIPYVAGWGEDGALDAIREYAEAIDANRPPHRGGPGPRARHAARQRHGGHSTTGLRLTRSAVRSGAACPDDRTKPAGEGVADSARRSFRRPASPRSGRMQPPTTPSTTATPHGDEDQLYRRHHRDLTRAVARVVDATPELIEDACQNAWAILLRHQPERGAIFAWLRVVAVHEAYRLSAIERRDAHLEAIATAVNWEEVISDRAAIDNALEAREALRVVAELPPRQRDDLTLFVAGYSYREIAELTAGRTFTNVNKHLARARACIRLQRIRATKLDAR